MSLNKPATKELPYWFYRERYLRNLAFETCHNILFENEFLPVMAINKNIFNNSGLSRGKAAK
jgi:hypothetical protein